MLVFHFVFVFADDITGRSVVHSLVRYLSHYLHTIFFSISFFIFVYRICATWLNAVHPLMRATQNQEKKKRLPKKTAITDRRRKHRWIVIIIITSVWALEINKQNFGKFLLQNFTLCLHFFCFSFFRQIISGDSLSFDIFDVEKNNTNLRLFFCYGYKCFSLLIFQYWKWKFCWTSSKFHTHEWIKLLYKYRWWPAGTHNVCINICVWPTKLYIFEWNLNLNRIFHTNYRLVTNWSMCDLDFIFAFYSL